MRARNELDRSVMHLLHRANQSVADLFSREIKSDLTPRQLAVLAFTAKNEGCSQADLTEALGIDRSTISELVLRLKRKGMLQRRRTLEDTRKYSIKLTDDGARILRTAEPLARRADKKVLRALGKRSSAFLDLLSDLANSLDVSPKA